MDAGKSQRGWCKYGKEDHTADGEIISDGGDVEMEELEDDPLMVFGPEIMTMIFNRLDARSVAQTCLVSREWLPVASSDSIWADKIGDSDAIFTLFRLYNSGIIGIDSSRDIELYEIVTCATFQCDELMQRKAHIPRILKAGGFPKLAAYSMAMMDAKRTRITRQDLCDHPWEFHFAESAPDYWRNLDPYWTGSGAPPMRRYFHPDGSVTADPHDPVWGGHESSYTIVTGLLADGKIRDHYIRINRWPKLSVDRKPDWGWQLSNHHYCYTSVSDAADRQEGTGPIPYLLDVK